MMAEFTNLCVLFFLYITYYSFIVFMSGNGAARQPKEYYMKRRNMLMAVMAGMLVCATASFAAEGAPVKGNPKSKIYHKAECKHYAAKGSTKEFASEADAVKAGYTACKKCSAKKKEAEKK